METRTKSSTFRILFLLRKTKLNKHGLGTITVRITIDGEAVEFSSKLFADPALWNSQAGRMNGKSKVATETNTSINFILTRLNNKYKEILDYDDYITADKLRDSFFGLEEKKHTLLTLFNKKVEQKKALVGHGISQDTVDKYICTKGKVASFIIHYYKKEDLSIKEVGYDFITNYDIYLRSHHNCGDNTVVRHLRYLKQVTTDALKCHSIHTDPFFDFVLTSKKGDRKFLTEEELTLIINKEFSTKVLREVRDIFVFCCYTGLAYIDVFY